MAHHGGGTEGEVVLAGTHEAHEEWLDLADAIALLRDQVADARGRIATGDGGTGGDRGVLFSLGDVTLELGVELTRSRQGGGALAFGAYKYLQAQSEQQ